MDGERRTDNTSLLLDLLQRTTAIETRSEAREAWQKQIDAKLERFEKAQGEQLTKLDALIAQIDTAKTVARFGGGMLGYVMKLLPYGATAAGSAWLSTLWSKS